MDETTELQVVWRPLEEGVVLLDLLGEVDVVTSPKIKEAVISIVKEGYGKVVVSLEQVRYIDSSGLGVLLGALKKVRELHGHICLVCNNPQIIKIFEITGLANVFEICKCREEGLESLRATCLCLQ